LGYLLILVLLPPVLDRENNKEHENGKEAALA